MNPGSRRAEKGVLPAVRVLLAAKFHQSGQTAHLVDLARSLRKMGHEVLAAALGRPHPRPAGPYFRELEKSGIPLGNAANVPQFLSLAAAFSPDVAHGHSSTAVPYLLALKKSRGVPAVLTCHGFGVPQRCPAVAGIDRCIAVGPNVARELKAHGLAPVVIPNGVDTDRFRPGRKPPVLKVAYVGRVDATKRRALSELILAVRGIPGAQLAVASNERPAAPGVAALGWVEDVAAVLAESHVVCGAGRAIREGMACGAIGIVLGSRYGGPVTPDRCEGEAIPSFGGAEGDWPRAGRIRADIVRLTQDAATRERLAAWSRDFACRRFSLDDTAAAVVRVYESAGAGRP